MLERLLASCVMVMVAAVTAGADTPVVRLEVKKDATCVVVNGLDKATLNKLGRLAERQKAEVFSLYVERTDTGREGQPAVLGAWQIDEGTLRFTPRFSLTRGTRYIAVMNLGKLDGGKAKVNEVRLSLPKVVRQATTTVARVYPTADRLPENLLKFYLHFSAPMDQGQSYQHIQLLDSTGKAIDLPFLELDQELWNVDGTRFTLFFDPGRIKRGLKPREEVGPSLEEGKSYTLVIAKTWKDAEGTPLKETFKKTFTVLAPDDTQPDPKKWKLTAPTAGNTPKVGRTPLRVSFPKPMDHALLERMLWVVDSSGKKVPGSVAVSAGETVWQFVPQIDWTVGIYHIVADTRLEDRCGNSIGRPFEVDVLRPVEKKIEVKTVRVPFEVKKADR